MPSETPAPRETQEQSIKARKHELFQAEAAKAEAALPKKTIKEYLRDTRPMKMSSTVKVTLWVAAVFVVLLFLASLLTKSSRPHRKIYRTRTGQALRQSAPITAYGQMQRHPAS